MTIQKKTFLYTPTMLRKIEEQIQAILKDNPEYGNYYYCKMIDYNRNPRHYVSCYAGYNSFFLDPYGNVYPCLLLDSSFGNIKEKSFAKVWKSNEAEKTRRRIKESRCHCWGCESEISFRRSWKVLFWSLIKRFSGYKEQG